MSTSIREAFRKMNKRIEGSYVRVEDAMHAVQRLKEEGYSSSDITVVANAAVRDSLPYTMDAFVSTDTDRLEDGTDDRSMWEKIKEAFTMDDYEVNRQDQMDYNPDTDPLSGYREEIEQGNVVVLVTEDVTPTGMEYTASRENNHEDNLDDTIELKEERLEVAKDKVQTGEVRIGKRIVEDMKTIEVPVTHEEITIERRPVTDSSSTVGSITEDMETEEIVIPIMEEQINVSKHAEVVEEVDIHRNKVTENKQVTDTVRKEELEVEQEGNITVEDRRDNGNDDSPFPL